MNRRGTGGDQDLLAPQLDFGTRGRRTLFPIFGTWMDLDRVLIKEGGSPPINSCLEHLQSLRDAGVKSVFHVLFVAEEIGYGHFPADRKIDSIEVSRFEPRQGQGGF